MLHGDLRLNLAEQYLLMDMFEISTSETQPDLVCYDDLKMKDYRNIIVFLLIMIIL